MSEALNWLKNNKDSSIPRNFSTRDPIAIANQDLAKLNNLINQEKFQLLLAELADKLAKLSFIFQVLTEIYHDRLLNFPYKILLSPETKQAVARLKEISGLFSEQIDNEQVFQIAYDTLGELGKFNPIIASNLISKFSSARGQAAAHAFGMTHCYTNLIAIDKLLELPSNSSTISALYQLGKITAFKTTMTWLLHSLLTRDGINEELDKLLTSDDERSVERKKLNQLMTDFSSNWNSPSAFFSTSSEEIPNEVSYSPKM